MLRDGTGPRGADDPLAAGALLVAMLGDPQAGDGVVVVVVDDRHWSDKSSAQALLFALRPGHDRHRVRSHSAT